MTGTKTLYDSDFSAWSQQQAEALRSTARGGSNQPLDWENLAEEIETLGRSERRELASRLSTIIEHCVKLSQSPASDPRLGSQQTIRRERGEIARLLEDSPSLTRDVAALAKRETRNAIELALRDLENRGELSIELQEALRTKSFVNFFSYSPEQILGDWFPPEPKS
jgi:hypothetical protein